MGNSIKYADGSKEFPFVDIVISEDSKKYTISIIDNGIGIDFDQQGKIFDMYYRASEQSNGSGLGLYIVKETVNNLGGSIEMISQPYVGTTFNIEFKREKSRYKEFSSFQMILF